MAKYTTYGEVLPGAPDYLKDQIFLGGSVPYSWTQAPTQGTGLVGGSVQKRREELAAQQAALAPGASYTPAAYTPYTPTAAYEPSQFYGLSEPGLYDEYQQSLFNQQMATTSTDFGRRGLMSSSMYGQAAVSAADAAMRQRLQIEMQENALRTQWGQQEAQRQTQFGLQQDQFGYQQNQYANTFTQAEADRRTRWEQEQQLQQWRESEAQAERQQQMQMLQQQINAQREAQKLADIQQFRQWYGSLTTTDSWRALDALLG